MTEFNYNNIKHLKTGFNPFKVVSGTEPLSRTDIIIYGTWLRMEMKVRSWKPSFSWRSGRES